jgi:hypothetical protein
MERLAAPAVSEPKSESAYAPAPTLKLATRDGVRTVDPELFRLVSFAPPLLKMGRGKTILSAFPA